MTRYILIESDVYERFVARLDVGPPCLRGVVGAARRQKKITDGIEAAIVRALDAAEAAQPAVEADDDLRLA